MPIQAKKIMKITTTELEEAYETHGNDFLVIDIDNVNDKSPFCSYINLYFRLKDDRIVFPNCWHIRAPDGLQISNNMNLPNSRQYPTLRVGVNLFDVSKDDESELTSNANATVFKYICEAFEFQMEKLKNTETITDDKKKQKKQPDGTLRPRYFPSLKFDNPMQTSRMNRDTSDYEDMENPKFWISLQSKFYKPDERPEQVQYESYFYKNPDGTDDMSKPVWIHEFQTTFTNVNDFFYNKKTGKKIFKYLGDFDAESKITTLDNTNIHKYLTKGSTFTGELKFQIGASGRNFKLNAYLGNNISVNVEQLQSSNDFSNTDAELLHQRFNKNLPKEENTDEDEEEEDEEEEEEEEEEELDD
jgi:hypothetical protein